MTAPVSPSQPSMAVPNLDRVSVVFGDISHMPKYSDLPEEFQDWHYNPFCKAVSMWFYKGCEPAENGIRIEDTIYTAKEGVKAHDAMAAIKAVLSSWAPKHEHKIAACGYMLHEWFDAKPAQSSGVARSPGKS